jgi:C-terminal processing protease CtpA/Prc
MQFGYASITVSDFVLHNGERLEKKGVIPDITVIPKPHEIAADHDPVLAYAITSAGVQITPAVAATILRPR